MENQEEADEQRDSLSASLSLARIAHRRYHPAHIKWSKKINIEIMFTHYYVKWYKDSQQLRWRHSFHAEYTRPKGYTPLKLNYQSVEWCNRNTRRSEHLKTKTLYMESSQTLYRKIMWTKNPPCCGFLQAMSILRWKVLQSPSMTGLSKTEIIRYTA